MPAFIPTTITAMRSLIDNYIVNNTSNAITPAEIRGILQTMLDFCLSYFGNQEVQTLVVAGAATTFDVQSGANAMVTLHDATTTLSIDNLVTGQYCTLVVKQGSGGNKALVFDDPTLYAVINAGAGAVLLSTSAGATDTISFLKMPDVTLVMYGINFTTA